LKTTNVVFEHMSVLPLHKVI